jgi:regulatory protein YycH of two-component signal transduction system YycFG
LYFRVNDDTSNTAAWSPWKQVSTTENDLVFTSGNTIYSTSGFTNQVGSWNNGANYFDVFPPAGKSMANLRAFIPSIAVIHYAGGVNGDDSMRCTWSNLGDRIRVYVQNTEQRSTPAANYLAIWR